MGLRTALEIWRRLELLWTMPDRSTEGENGTSPNPWLELTLGAEKNHWTDKPNGELDLVSSDGHLNFGQQMPREQGTCFLCHSCVLLRPASAELPTRPRIFLLFLLFPQMPPEDQSPSQVGSLVPFHTQRTAPFSGESEETRDA